MVHERRTIAQQSQWEIVYGLVALGRNWIEKKRDDCAEVLCEFLGEEDSWVGRADDYNGLNNFGGERRFFKKSLEMSLDYR